MQISHDSEVGDGEDRGFGVLVDRDDRSGVLHSDQMLHRARDAGGDVDARLDGLARLSDLKPRRDPSGVDDGTGRADCSVQL